MYVQAHKFSIQYEKNESTVSKIILLQFIQSQSCHS